MVVTIDVRKVDFAPPCPVGFGLLKCRISIVTVQNVGVSWARSCKAANSDLSNL